MMSKREIVRCPSCDGYGWFSDDFGGEAEDCDWCGGIGYVYRDVDGVDSVIPPEDYKTVAPQLEALENERMREIGYTGTARRPWEQDIREGTKGGENPYQREDDDSAE